jgi:parallel beta-helix repeat protein
MFIWALALAGIILVPQRQCAQTSGPVARWKFDEGARTLAADSSQNGNNGTLRGQATWTAGRSGAALFLTGSNSYVTVPQSSSLSSATSLTIAFWYNAQDVADIDERILTATSSWDIKLNGANRYAQITSAAGRYAAIRSPLPQGSWQHIAFTHTAGVLKAYLNGVPQSFIANTFSADTPLTAPRNGLVIGADSSYGNFAKGALDDLVVYNRALTDSEILSLYKGETVTGAPTPTADPNAFWVSPSGSDFNPGTQALPWATLNKAAAALKPGQTAYLTDGSYAATQRLDWSANGTSTAPITIAAAPGSRPVVYTMINMSGSYLRLQNLIIDKNNQPTDSRPGARPAQTGGQPGGNIGVWLNSCNSCVLEGNEIRNTTMSGLFVSDSSQVTITRNFIHDVGTTSDDHGIYFHDGGAGSTISNNLILRAYDFGIHLYPSPSGLRVVNNTIAASGTRGLTGGGGAGIILDGTNIAIANNIFVDNRGGAVNVWIASSNSAYNNVYWNNGSSDTNGGIALPGANNVHVNPQFVSATDFHPSAGSPAIGAGASSYAPPVDIDGRTRHVPPDAGAYEH